MKKTLKKETKKTRFVGVVWYFLVYGSLTFWGQNQIAFILHSNCNLFHLERNARVIFSTFYLSLPLPFLPPFLSLYLENRKRVSGGVGSD